MELLRWLAEILIIFWFLGLVLNIGGGLIHIVIVIAVILFILILLVEEDDNRKCYFKYNTEVFHKRLKE
jgi:4-hydroxybenzoate polyprenyltransferase